MVMSVVYICTTSDKYTRSKRPTTIPIYLQLQQRNKIVVKNNNHLRVNDVVLVKLTVIYEYDGKSKSNFKDY